MRVSRLDFIREQGYPLTAPDDRLYSALMLQPRIIGVLTVLGVALQSGALFTGLALVLCWSALVPARNPFDAIYNVAVARPRGLARLTAAPAPRRFAMTMAATMAFAIGAALLTNVRIAAWPLETLFVVAVAAVVFANRCAAATLYHVLRRRLSPEDKTMPTNAATGRC